MAVAAAAGPSGNLSAYLFFIDKHFNFDEVRDIAFRLDVDIDAVNYSSKRDVIRELLAYLNRRERLTELEDLLRQMRPKSEDLPYLFEKKDGDVLTRINFVSGPHPPIYTGSGDATYWKPPDGDIVTGTEVELIGTRQQIEELKNILKEQGNSTGDQVTKILDEMNKSIKIALSRTEELKADLIPPSTEDRQIKLIPEHHINRLEEYRSDENIIYLLIGLFAGATVGIIVNWATNDPFNPGPVSITFLGLFLLLTIVTGFWAYRLNKRTKAIIYRIFPERRIIKAVSPE